MPSDLRSVAAYAPMKRGLKAPMEGATPATPPLVAAYAPMKRGLKGLK